MNDPAANGVFVGGSVPTPEPRFKNVSAFFSHGAVLAIISGSFVLGAAYFTYLASGASKLPELEKTIERLTTERDSLTQKVETLESRPVDEAVSGIPADVYKSAQDALSASQQKISSLESQLQQARVEIQRAVDAKNAAEQAVTDIQLGQQTPGAIVEHLSVPPPNFIPIMQKEYLLQLLSIKDGVAEVSLKSMTGSDDDLFLTKGSQIVRFYREMSCRLTVTDVTEKLLSVMTSCSGKTD